MTGFAVDVKFMDGQRQTYRLDTRAATIDSLHLRHGSSGVTAAQPVVARDSKTHELTTTDMNGDVSSHAGMAGILIWS